MLQSVHSPCTGAAAPSRAPRRLALWSDDDLAAAGWRQALEAEGLAVDAAGAAGGADAAAFHVHGGLTAQLGRLRELRAALPALPLVVACRGLRELDQVLALEMGADDVFDAALGAPVVAARLRALWRRAGAGAAEPAELVFGALRLVLRERRVWWQGVPLPLSEGEFEVLWLLACRAGHAVSRREILRHVRGLDDHPLDRSIDSRVYRIRAKLGDGGRGGNRIRTVRHQGYAFSPLGW